MLVLAKANPAIKEKSGKGYLVRISGIGGGKIILTLLAEVVILHLRFIMRTGLLTGLLEGLVLGNLLAPREQIYAEFCDSLEVFFNVLGGSRSRDESSWGWRI